MLELDAMLNELTKIAEYSGEMIEGNCYTYHQSTQKAAELLNKRLNYAK